LEVFSQLTRENQSVRRGKRLGRQGGLGVGVPDLMA
jgi:hypothetical protein